LTLRHLSEAQNNKLPDQPTLKEQIHQANVIVHRFEAKYYEPLHPEVYSKQEQKRVTAKLITIDRQITNNQRNALDVGAGTGNLTGKLLQMGYNVTATDISPEMCQILKKKYAVYLPSKLTVINSPIEDLSFSKGEFDLVTFYSVLHHLPDYLAALRGLSGFLKKGGVMYIDHEASPFYWKKEPNSFASFIKDLYFHSNPILNSLYFQITGLKVPTIDYTLSDYWHKKEHAVNHHAIEEVFKAEGFEFFTRTDYYQHATWTPNPLYPIYRLLCRPEMSYWIAKR
jgi:ubiquinone/menaquinone biosynthesis C-methylase UbiE